MKLSFEKIMKHIDWLTICVGVFSLVLSLFGIDCIYLTGLASVLFIVYFLYAIYLWIQRPKFDWHLINGHSLKKVVAFVLLVPSFITSGFLIYNSVFREEIAYSPKNLIYDENLYTINDTIRLTKDRLKDTTYLRAYNFTKLSDSTAVQKCKIPDPGISDQTSPSIFWTVYYHFIDPGNQHMTTSQSGRGWSALIAILGVFLLNGLLVSSIIGWIDSRKEKWQSGSLRYKLKHLGKYKFAVVIGANEIAASVIQNLLTPKKEGEINYKCEGENDYVILQTSREVEDVRVELASHLSNADRKRVIIYKALRDSIEEVHQLHIEYSTEVYVLGESTIIDGSDTYHDAMNMRCVNLIVKELNKTYDARKTASTNKGKSARKVCKVMFEYQTTSSIFLFSDVSTDINKNLIFIPFNRYESWAKTVIANNTAIEDCNKEVCEQINYTPLDGMSGISEDDETHVHFIVVGMSKIGVAMGVQSMMQSHYLNFAKAEIENDSNYRIKQKDARRTRITFIDTNADKEMAFFKGRYENLFNLTRHRYVDANQCVENDLSPNLCSWIDPMQQCKGKWEHLSDGGENFIDIELEFIKGELESDGVRKYLQNISDKTNSWVKNSNLTISICLTRVHQAIAASLYMPLCVYEKAQEIWVYQRESADIVLNLTKTEQKDKRYKKLKPFGMLYGDYMSDRSQYLKALLVNGAYALDVKKDGNIVVKAENRNMANKEEYKDLRKEWRTLTLDKKFSNRYFVDSIQLKIRSVNAIGLSFLPLKETISCHTETLARSEHNRWNIQQLLLGYAPCDKKADDEFVELNAAYKDAYKALDEWHKLIGWDNLSKEQQEGVRDTDDRCRELEKKLKESKDAFQYKKNFYKEGENRMHPNICAYNHLDKVDFEAKDYDTYLNSMIPTIKLLVDDRIELRNSENNNA